MLDCQLEDTILQQMVQGPEVAALYALLETVPKKVDTDGQADLSKQIADATQAVADAEAT